MGKNPRRGRSDNSKPAAQSRRRRPAKKKPVAPAAKARRRRKGAAEQPEESDDWAPNVGALAVRVGKSVPVLYGYVARGMTLAKTPRGYEVGPIREWISKNIHRARNQSAGRVPGTAESLYARLKKYEAAYKRERTLKARAERMIAQGAAVPKQYHERVVHALIALFTRGLDDLPRNIQGLTPEQMDTLRLRVDDIRTRIADEARRTEIE